MIGISVLSHQRRRGEKQTGEDRAVITAVHRILLEVEITPDAIQRAGIIGYGYNNERTLLKLKRGVPNAVSGRRQQWSFTHVHALQKHMEQYKSRWYLSVVAGCGCFFWYVGDTNDCCMPSPAHTGRWKCQVEGYRRCGNTPGRGK
jgi:hypothetical protein